MVKWASGQHFWKHSLSRWFLLGLTFVSVGAPLVTGRASTLPATVNEASTVLSSQAYRRSSALDLAAAIRSGKVTSVELVKLAFAKLKADNPHLNAVITLREKQALQEAASLKDTGQPFFGVPILIKGLGQAMAGESNTNGLLTARQATYSKTGTFVANLQKAGFIVIGQTNFPEMGLLNVTTSKLYGDARNAWDPGFQPGGSSGGSATSVADGIVPIATGNDAGGSIRIPASWSGLVGLKPTQSIIQGDSPTGHGVNFAETKTMADTESLFNALATNQAQPAPKTLKHVTVAYSLKSPVNTPVSPDAIQAVQQAVKFLEQQGIKVKQVDPPLDGVALMKDYYVRNTSAGAYSAQLTKAYQKREMVPDDVSPLNWGLYQASKNVTDQQLKAAETEIDQAANTMENFHQKYALLLQPTTATTAPSIGDPSVLPENEAKLRHMETIPVSQQMPLIYDSWLHGLTKTPYTQQANLTDEPAISLPTYVSAKGMPLGIQFNAAKGQDRLLMKVGELFEQHHQFKLLQDYQKSDNTITPKKVYVTRAFKTYQDIEKLTVKQNYSTHSRATAPTFSVLGVVANSHQQLFYRTSAGYLPVEVAHNLYYQTMPQQSKVITQRGLYEYKRSTLKRRIKLVRPKTTLKVKKIVFQGHVTRYQLTNGHYITANRQFIQWR